MSFLKTPTLLGVWIVQNFKNKKFYVIFNYVYVLLQLRSLVIVTVLSDVWTGVEGKRGLM